MVGNEVVVLARGYYYYYYYDLELTNSAANPNSVSDPVIDDRFGSRPCRIMGNDTPKACHSKGNLNN